MRVAGVSFFRPANGETFPHFVPYWCRTSLHRRNYNEEFLRRIWCKVFLLLGTSTSLFAQILPGNEKSYPPAIPLSPKYEVRAVWITTVGGLDWPRSFGKTEQQRSMREMIAQVKAAHFNTIFFQVRGRADAMYRSHYEPWSQQLTGEWGKDPGWDPLQFVLDEAHAQGLEVHAWFNTFLVKNGPLVPTTWPPHLAQLHPEWAKLVGDEWWLDAGLPQIRFYLVKVALDIARNYDIDGIHFDFIRYPGPKYPDDATYRKYGVGATREEWRRENINAFVRAAYDSIKAVKPMLKIGSTPIGIYVNVPSSTGLESFHSVFQDSRTWLRERKHDYLVPQVYWSIGNPAADFGLIVSDWSGNTFNRHVYIGVGAYKPEVFRQIPELIDATRRAELHGNSFFRYEHISQWWRVGERYALPAIVPPMPWKDPTPPAPPTDLRAQDLGEGAFLLQWRKPPRAPDGDFPKRYVLYRSRTQPVDYDDPANIVAITVGADTSLIDTIARPTGLRYFYAVTALDKMNNESQPTNEGKVILAAFASLAKEFSLSTALAEPYSEKARAFIPYVLGDWATVQVTVLDSSGGSVRALGGEIQGPGKYVQSLDLSSWKPGFYLVRLNAGQVFTKPLRVE